MALERSFDAFNTSKQSNERKVTFSEQTSQEQASTVKNEFSEVESIKVMKFAENRSMEIAALSEEVMQKTSNTRLMQTLPIYMRRRAMSHSSKRLPRRLRDQANRELKKMKSKPKQTKCPSRWHRRRPSNLLLEYARRQKKNVWLETHIWHAKRFHMKDIWNYKIPDYSNDKGIRAAYRSSNRFAVLQDHSYYCCIELKGQMSVLLSGLTKITCKKSGPTFASKATLSGQREGQVMIYKVDKYPYGAITKVSFVWMPPNSISTDNDDKPRKLWIWCHPSCYAEVKETLAEAFAVNLNDDFDSIAKDEELKFVERSKLNSATSNDHVFMTSLKDSLVRFRLTGPDSHLILVDLIKLLCPSKDLISSNSNFSCDQYEMIFNKQKKIWEKISSCSYSSLLPPHLVIGLSVKDPRLTMPVKRTKLKPKLDGSDLIYPEDILCNETPHSLIWSAQFCDHIRSIRKTDQKVNSLRSEQIIPGSEVTLPESECSTVPLLLIQYPGISKSTQGKLSYSGGWDIIVPSGWSMAFWLPLVFRGARVVGLREHQSISEDAGFLCFPNDYPDTEAYESIKLNEGNQAIDKYFRKPPAKRPNYKKLAAPSAFISPWFDLCSDWVKIAVETNGNTNDLTCGSCYVLRDLNKIRLLQEFLCGKSELDLTTDLFSEFSNALVAVSVQMHCRGVPKNMAMICEPVEKDLIDLESSQNTSGPCEPIHKDTDAEINKEYFSEIHNCVQLPSRRIIGFITSGRFVFSHGQGSGIGFVSVLAILQMFKKRSKNIKILIRNNESYQYRYADLEILDSL